MICITRTSDFSAQFGNGPDLTALIDIVFIVVVFLLLTANTSLLTLPVELPKTDSEIESLSVEQKRILISIKPTTPHWSLRIESDTTEQHHETWEKFESALLALSSRENTHLLIATDKEANASLLLKLLAFLNAHELNNTQILMEAQ
jgi:biopolymer transport protein ExbD